MRPAARAPKPVSTPPPAPNAAPPSAPAPKAPSRRGSDSGPGDAPKKRLDPFALHVSSSPVSPPTEPTEKAAPPATAPADRRPRSIQTAAHLGVPAIIWGRDGNPARVSPEERRPAATDSEGSALRAPQPVESPPEPFEAPDPHRQGDCDVCSLARPTAALHRCPVCRRETCDECRKGDVCALCSDLRIPDAAERKALEPLSPPADGVRISSGTGVRVVTIQSGPRRELAIMQDGAIERWWRADRTEPNHYRVNRALELRLGMRDAATLKIAPLTGPGQRGEVLEVGGDGRLVAEISTALPGGGSTSPESMTLEATPPGPSGLLRALAQQLNCEDKPVPWVIPAGMREHFERLVAPTDDAAAAVITLAPEVRRSGVRVGADGLIEENGGVAPFAAIESGSAPPLGGRLDEWFPRPRVVSAARGVAGSAVLLEIGGEPVLAIQDGDEVTYHCATLPSPSAEEILGSALNPAGTPAQASATIDPAHIEATPVGNAELVGRRARPVARPSLDWASPEATATAITDFRLEKAVRRPEVSLDLPAAVAEALKTEMLRGGVPRPDVIEVGAEVHEHWSGRESETEFVYVLYPADDDGSSNGRVGLTLDDEGHLATHARLCVYCGTTRCDECHHLVRSCIVCKVDLCASCRGPAAIGLPICPACSTLAPAETTRRFGRRARGVELLTGADDAHEVAVERRDDEWFLVSEGDTRVPIARDYRVAGFLQRRLDDGA